MAGPLLPILTRLLAGGAGGAGASSTLASGGSAAGSIGGSAASGAASSGAAPAASIPSQAMQFEQLQGMLQMGQGAVGTVQAFDFGSSGKKTSINPLPSMLTSAASPAQRQVLVDAGNVKKEAAGVAKDTLFGGSLGMIQGGFKIATIMATLPMRLEKWSEALTESQRHLMRFNGTIARAFVESERRGMLRDIQSGVRTSGSTSDLRETLDDLKDELQPMRDVLTNLSNRVVELLARMATNQMRLFNEYGPYISGVYGLLERYFGDQMGQADPTMFMQLQRDLRDVERDPHSPIHRRRVPPREGT